MSTVWLYWALLAHMGLVIFIYLLLLRRKTAAARAGGIDRKRSAVDLVLGRSRCSWSTTT